MVLEAKAEAAAPLVGRERELEALESALARLADGRAALVEIPGEPGIGKTRLLEVLCARADTRGYLVLEGRAAEYEVDLPYGLVIDALNDYVATRPASELASLGGDRLADLAALMPAIAAATPADGAPYQGERYRGWYAVRALLECLAAKRPLVLALDDVHWADPASVELIMHLLRRPPAAAVLLAVALRPRQTPDPLLVALDRAARDTGALRLDPGPLTVADSKRLLSTLPVARRVRLHEMSGGNPFYLDQLARAAVLDEEAPASAAARSAEALPPPVIAALRNEVAALPGPVRELAAAAAVAGEPFEPETAAAAAGVEVGAALLALDTLLAADIVRPTETPRRFRFRHPIVRRALYDTARPGWRMAAHQRLAALLAERQAPLDQQARHVQRSARAGDAEAIELLSRAGKQYAPVAPSVAADWFAAALRLLEEGDPRRLMLLPDLARSLASAGRLSEARTVLEQVHAALPAELTGYRARTIAYLADLDTLIGDDDRAGARIRAALDELGMRDARAAIDLRTAMAGDCMMRGDYAAMARWAAEALAAARAEGDQTLIASAATTTSLSAYHHGRIPEALATAEEAVAALAKTTPKEERELAISLAWLGWAYFFVERHEQALEITERGQKLARERRIGLPLVPLLAGKAHALCALGRVSEAVAVSEEAVEAAEETRAARWMAWGAGLWAMRLAGRSEEVVAQGERQLSLLGPHCGVRDVLMRLQIGEARLEIGDPTGAARDLLGAGGSELPMAERPLRPFFYDALARAEIARGRPERAVDWADRATRAAEGLGLAGRTASALRAQAVTRLALGGEGAVAEAIASAQAAVSAAQEGEGVLDIALSQAVAGRVLAAAGRTRAAIVELRAATSAFERGGAAGPAAAAGAELAALQAEGSTVGAQLTPREREIAKLVAAGHSNRAIGDELGIGQRTVETHVSRLLAKLGVDSRAAVAAALARTVD